MKNIIYITIGILLTLSSCTNTALNRAAFVLDINTIAFADNKPIWFGSGQDIMMQYMPDSVLSVNYNRRNNEFTWNLRHPAYVIINDSINPNKISFTEIQDVQVEGHSINIETLRNSLDRYFDNAVDDYKYVRLADVLKVINEGNNITTNWLNTLIAYNKSGQYLILLDLNILVTTNTGISRFRDSDTISGKSMKIEFFRVINSSAFGEIPGEIEKNTPFHLGDTLFYCRVKSFYTPFGANEITLQANDNSVLASFDRIYRAVIPRQSIDKVFKENDRIPISLRQIIHANTYSNEIYSMNLANPGYLELGTINPDSDYKFEPSGQSIFLKNGKYTSYTVNGFTFWKWCLPLLLVFISGLLVISFLNTDNVYEGEDNQGEGNRWKLYFLVLYFVLFILGIGRIFIGYNLAFTQPFFPNNFPTAVFVSPMILLNVLLVWLVLLILKQTREVVTRESLIAFAAIPAILMVTFLISKNSSDFAFYWDNFNTGKYLSAFLTLKRINLKDFSPYIHTINLLIILSIVNVILLFFGMTKIRTKVLSYLFHIILIVLAILFFGLGRNSYSAGMLLGIIITFPFLLKWFKVGNKKNFIFIFFKKYVFFILFISFVFIITLLIGDSGYFINLYAFLIVIAIVLFGVYAFYSHNEHIIFNWKRSLRNLLVICVLGFVSVYGLWKIGKVFIEYDPLTSNRLETRLTTFYDFDKIHEAGYRDSEEQGQFFAILTKYAYPSEYNCNEPIHPGISTYIDPVVENDLSVPFGLIYQFGALWWISIVFLLLLWIILSGFVFKCSILPIPLSSDERQFTTFALLRLYCVSMLVGSGIWLLASYYNAVPFTGRLIFGLGQDSVAEVFETLFLFSFMGLVGRTN